MANIFLFLEKLIENNIYKYLNSLNIENITSKSEKHNKNKNKLNKKDAIENLFDNKEFIYDNINYLNAENDIRKLSNPEYLYVLIKSNNECNIKCNIVEYNSNTNNLTENELKTQIENI